MKALEALNTDETILEEIGYRLGRQRLALNLTQSELADQAGVSKSTVERIERGESAQLSSWIRILRALGFVEGLNQLIPEPQPSPMAQLKLRGKERQRARKKKAKPPTYRGVAAPGSKVAETSPAPWVWGEDR